ncbi:MAG: elongation factor P, partial [Dehalococcoidia bacterium]|nr:elongation factor P [Dehalococcoidia bacterium]
MINYSDLKKGVMVEIDGDIYQVTEYAPFRHAQRAAMAKVKFKNIKNGRNIEKTLQPGEKLMKVQLEGKTLQYLYRDGDLYCFMDVKNFEQLSLNGDLLGDNVNYLHENINIQLLSYKDVPVMAELPITVELVVEETGPAYKGDTAQSGTKPARMETGLEVKVPLFIANGDRIKIDTRTGEYLE